ncbi:MAG: RNA polymerase sigma factor [Mycobacteriales bacterium]
MAASICDPGRFTEIVERHFTRVYRYLARRVGRETADDLAAETFLIAFRDRKRYDLSRPNASPWLMGIATNLLKHHLRAEVRRLIAYSRALPDCNVCDPIGDTLDRLAAKADLARLLLALARLKRELRDVVSLVLIEELTYEDAAIALDIPVGTVRSRLSRARVQLRRMVESGDSERLIRGRRQ